VAANNALVAPPSLKPNIVADSTPAASITLRRSSTRSVSGGTWVAASDSPPPRMSQTTKRVTWLSCLANVAKALAGSSNDSTFRAAPGVHTTVVSASPNTR